MAARLLLPSAGGTKGEGKPMLNGDKEPDCNVLHAHVLHVARLFQLKSSDIPLFRYSDPRRVIYSRPRKCLTLEAFDFCQFLS